MQLASYEGRMAPVRAAMESLYRAVLCEIAAAFKSTFLVRGERVPSGGGEGHGQLRAACFD
ncbi:hypothetical protein WT32_02370 [Burkholderia anthina]|nr:hypothetical protein WT32_02370 [Burkholderia anthina]